MEEHDLILQLRQGDEKAFEIIFRKYFAGLCLFAEHFVRDHETAEEITEDFFCHLWDNCHDLSITTSLSGYLYRSMHNRCLNYLRNRKVRQQYVADNQYFFTDEEILGKDTEDQPVSNLIARELEKNISDAIDGLPEQCRVIFSLNRFEDLSYVEIADKLNLSVNTVKTQMARALQKLRYALKEFLIIALMMFFIH